MRYKNSYLTGIRGMTNLKVRTISRTMYRVVTSGNNVAETTYHLISFKTIA